MFVLKFTALAVFGVSAVPKVVQPRAATTDPACPVLYTETFTETLSIIAPTTTGPFETTTFTDVLVSYPLATTTETQVDANGKSYTVTYTYTDW